MTQAELAWPMVIGCLLGFFTPLVMRIAHRLPMALNWGGDMPDPAVLQSVFLHPKYGHHSGHRVLYCESDAEVVEMIPARAPSSWREREQPKSREETW